MRTAWLTKKYKPELEFPDYEFKIDYVATSPKGNILLIILKISRRYRHLHTDRGIRLKKLPYD